MGWKNFSLLRFLWEKVKKPRAQKNYRAENPQTIPVHLSSHSYRAIQHHPTTEEKQHRTTERYYWQEQRRLAEKLNDLTRTLNWITGVASGVGVVGLIFIACTLIETRRQTDTAERSLALSQRPWVGFGKITPRDKLTPEVPLEILVEIKNAGDSPGLRVSLHYIFSPWRRTKEDKRLPFRNDLRMAPCVGPEPRQTESAGGALILPTSNGSYTASYISGALSETVIKILESEKGQDINAPVKDLDVIPRADDQPRGQETVGLYFVGCLNYFDELRVAHRTTFCYSYQPAPPNGIFVACEEGNDAT